MVDVCRRRPSKAKLPIEGMESVVITVTGYNGSERFELIKLIDKAGANHVGTMNESITHLVCWKYEGRKYELARKFKTMIVNHQWIEDCITKGRRVLESPYTTKCGQQVGPLVLNVSSIYELSGYQSSLQRENKGHKRSNETIRSCELKVNKHRPLKEIRKGSYRVKKSINSRCLFDEPPSPGLLKVKTNRESVSAEPSSTGRKRRLAKKIMSREPLELSSDSEGDNGPFSFLEHRISAPYANDLDVKSHRDVHDSSQRESAEDFSKVMYDVDDIEDVNLVLEGEDKCLPGNGTSSSQHMDINQKVGDIGDAPKLPAPSELSCVICWTDFSDSRGILPCGHRFCFACIRSWADHMVSSGKTSTCPLCKACFLSITKTGDAVPSDQKIYSQTIPLTDSRTDIYILPGGDPQNFISGPSGAPVCCQCSCGEPEDLLVPCHFCQIRYIHSYCQDPPVSPWACGHCRDLHMLYLHIR